MSASKRMIKSLRVGALGLAIGVVVPTSCTQPQILCTTGHGVAAARYTLKSGDANSECGALVGDVLGMNTYYAEKDGLPDFTHISIAIRPESVGYMVQDAVDRGADVDLGSANAVGNFVDHLPDGDDFCAVEDFEAKVSLPLLKLVPGVEDDPSTPDVDESVPEIPEQPPMEITMEWSKTRFYVTADAQGTQFTAELKYTQNGCTAEYEVVGLFPAAGCETDKDCQVTTNGINPNFATECDTNLGLCIPKGDVPAYK